MENESKPAGSKRMDILQQSLAKKQTAFDNKLQAHFDDVQSANGQPLNDKRNGQATMNRWERQNESLLTLQKSIEKTEAAIEREQRKIDHVARTLIPEFLKPMLEAGEITQWRKYPNRFFVPGVEKARIVWHEDKQEFGYSHLQGVKGGQYAKFRDTYNHIRALHKQEREKTLKINNVENPVQDTVVDKARQSALSDKYQAARDAYVKQTVLFPDPQRQRRNLLESQMENLIKGLPEQTQMQARTNFYVSQVSGQIRQKSDKPTLGQGEIEFDR
ncbi:hypothetical protein LVJ85_10955 [Neisseria sp. Dent CA1/247]|uniref:hypothetical protein n=1 Tax=Neisseria sp. Dent CA1/247 TaxID=2912675 RepID=UPI001FD62F6F|nr:hypothetical protein [Neisseria sp. Dent CA1/247]UOO76513.1 hypothetical protein LVJ85_10955 [Neisseria sp. Dent CA1/247]